MAQADLHPAPPAVPPLIAGVRAGIYAWPGQRGTLAGSAQTPARLEGVPRHAPHVRLSQHLQRPEHSIKKARDRSQHWACTEACKLEQAAADARHTAAQTKQGSIPARLFDHIEACSRLGQQHMTPAGKAHACLLRQQQTCHSRPADLMAMLVFNDHCLLSVSEHPYPQTTLTCKLFCCYCSCLASEGGPWAMG